MENYSRVEKDYSVIIRNQILGHDWVSGIEFKDHGLRGIDWAIDDIKDAARKVIVVHD